MAAIGTTSGPELVRMLEEGGISPDVFQGEIVDIGAGAPQLANSIAHTYDDISAINCIDPGYSQRPMTKDRMASILESQYLKMSHPLDELRCKIAKDAMTLLDGKGLSPKIHCLDSATSLPDKSQSMVIGTYLLSNIQFYQPLFVEIERILKDDGTIVFVDHQYDEESDDDISGWTMLKNFIRENGIEIGEYREERLKGYLANMIVLSKENIKQILAKLHEEIKHTGVQKVTIQDDESEYEFIIIPYERIANGLLTAEECSMLEKTNFDMNEFMRDISRNDHMSQIGPHEDDTIGWKFFQKYLVIGQNYLGEWCAHDLDEEDYEKIAAKMEFQGS